MTAVNYSPVIKLEGFLSKKLNDNKEEVIDLFSFFLQELNKVEEDIAKWNMQGESLEEALKLTLMEVKDGEVVIDKEVLGKFNEEYGVVTELWSGNIKHSASISIVDHTDEVVSFAIRDRVFEQYKNAALVNLMQVVLSKWHVHYFSVYFGGDVPEPIFPDRPAVGKMIYLPVELEVNDVTGADAIINIKNDINTGAIIIPLNYFDPMDKKSYAISNGVAVELAAKNLLPYYSRFAKKI